MGLTQQEIEQIRAQPTLEARLTEALKLIPPSQLNYDRLAELVKSNRCSIRTAKKVIRVKLRELGLERKLGGRFKLNRIQLLRYRLGGYSGNLFEAAARWPGFRASEQDLRENVRLPLSINYEEARLLAIIWGDGYLKADQLAFYLNGTHHDFGFYEKIVRPEIKRIFNKETRIVAARGGSALFPRIQLSSLAVSSWLTADIGFTASRELPWLLLVTDEKARHGFLSGIIASMAVLEKSHEIYRRLRVYDRRQAFLLELAELAEQLGYSSRYDMKQKRLVFESRATRAMLADGIIFRPDQLALFKSAPCVLA